MAISRRRNEEGVKPPPTPPDYQEERALDRAAKALEDFRPGIANARYLAQVAISQWVLERHRLTAAPRMTAERVFDIGDARLRGFVEAALPRAGATLAEAGLPEGTALFDLSKEHIVDVFMAGTVGAQEAAMAAGESLGFPFSDEIPFG